MAKTINEHIAWQKTPEDRPWKIKVHLMELAFLILVSIACVFTFAVYDGPKRFEEAFYLFSGGLLLSQIALVPFLSESGGASRYVRRAVLLALVAGTGLLAGFGFVILTSTSAAV
jgi:uncharacterized membrane protein